MAEFENENENKFEALAKEHIEPGSIIINTDGTIKSVKIKGSDKEISNFNINIPVGSDNQRSILLHKLNNYNMFIGAYNNCRNTENDAVEKCMSINRIFENNTGESSSTKHGPCGRIFKCLDSAICLEKNLEKKQKIGALVREVKNYLENKNNMINPNQNAGKFKTKKTRSYKRKTDKRKKTKARKTNKRKKTNKRRKTKSKTNKRKKRTRRRR